MALRSQQQYNEFMAGLNQSFAPRQPSFFDRLGSDLGTFAGGFVPGLLAVAKSPFQDIASIVQGETPTHMLDVGKGLAQGLYESPIIGAPMRSIDELKDIVVDGDSPDFSRLLHGDMFSESWKHPGFAALDLATLATMGAGEAVTGPALLRKLGQNELSDSWMAYKGYKPVDDVASLDKNLYPSPRNMPVVDGMQWARPGKREVTIKYEPDNEQLKRMSDPEQSIKDVNDAVNEDDIARYYTRRAGNENFARVGDVMRQKVADTLPANWLFASPGSRRGRLLVGERFTLGNDETRISNEHAKLLNDLMREYGDMSNEYQLAMQLSSEGIHPQHIPVMMQAIDPLFEKPAHKSVIDDELLTAKNDKTAPLGIKVERRSLGIAEGAPVNMSLRDAAIYDMKRKAQGLDAHYKIIFQSPMNRHFQDSLFPKDDITNGLLERISGQTLPLDNPTGHSWEYQSVPVFDTPGRAFLEEFSKLSDDEIEALKEWHKHNYPDVNKSIDPVQDNVREGALKLGQAGIHNDIAEGRASWSIGRRAAEREEARQMRLDGSDFDTATSGSSIRYDPETGLIASLPGLSMEEVVLRDLSSIEDIIKKLDMTPQEFADALTRATHDRLTALITETWMDELPRNVWNMSENRSKRAIYTQRDGDRLHWYYRKNKETGEVVHVNGRLKELQRLVKEGKLERLQEMMQSEAWQRLVEKQREASQLHIDAMRRRDISARDEVLLNRAHEFMRDIFNPDGKFGDGESFYYTIPHESTGHLRDASKTAFEDMLGSFDLNMPNHLSDAFKALEFDNIDGIGAVNRGLTGLMENVQRAVEGRKHFDIRSRITDALSIKSYDDITELQKNGLAGEINDFNTTRHFAVLPHDSPRIAALADYIKSIRDLFESSIRNDDAEAIAQAREMFDSIDIGKSIRIEGEGRNKSRLVVTEKTLDELKAGKYVVVPTVVLRSIMYELGHTESMFMKLFAKGTNVWKRMVLQGRPGGFIRNNAIGSYLYLMMHDDPVQAMKALRTYYKARKNKKLGIEDAATEMYDFINTTFPEVMHGHGSGDYFKLGRIDEGQGKLRSFWNRYVDLVGDANQRIADQPPRFARALTEVERAVENYLSQPGNEGKTVRQALDDLSLSPEFKQHVLDEVFGDLVDYTSMSRFERDIVTQLFPFWSWIRGSTKSFIRLGADHPLRVWAMGDVAKMGEQQSLEEHGYAQPDFTKQWVGGPGDLILNTAGMSPFQTPVDMARMALQWIPYGQSYREYGSENVLNNLNPFLLNALQASTGRNLYFGIPLPRGESVGTSFAKGLFNVPPVTLGKSLLGGADTGPNATTMNGPGWALNRWAGIGLSQPRWGAVYKRGRDEWVERYGSLAPMYSHYGITPTVPGAVRNG